MDVLNKSPLPLKTEFPVKIRGYKGTYRITDTDAMGTCFNLRCNKGDGAFRDDVQRSVNLAGILVKVCHGHVDIPYVTVRCQGTLHPAAD